MPVCVSSLAHRETVHSGLLEEAKDARTGRTSCAHVCRCAPTSAGVTGQRRPFLEERRYTASTGREVLTCGDLVARTYLHMKCLRPGICDTPEPRASGILYHARGLLLVNSLLPFD